MVLNQELGTLRGGSRSNLGNPKRLKQEPGAKSRIWLCYSKKNNFEVNPIGL
jgi:hypothetical protein